MKVYFQNGLEFKTNDLYVTLQMGSLTGFYSIFRLNVNLFMDQPMKETPEYFENGVRPLRSDVIVKPELPLVAVKFEEDLKETKQELKKSQEKISEEDLKRKSMANFKRSKSRHIINQYGQIVGKEPMNEEEKAKNNSRILEKSKKKKTNTELAHNIFDPEDSMEQNMDDLYGTKKTFEVKHVKHPVLGSKPISQKPKSKTTFTKKTTMKLTFSKFDVDKAQERIPEDFEIVFNFRCMEENKKWSFEWGELEELRNKIIKKLESNPELGKIMINGKN